MVATTSALIQLLQFTREKLASLIIVLFTLALLCRNLYRKTLGIHSYVLDRLHNHNTTHVQCSCIRVSIYVGNRL